MNPRGVRKDSSIVQNQDSDEEYEVKQIRGKQAVPIRPANGFEFLKDHFYPDVLQSCLHDTVSSFFNMSNDVIIQRYCHMNPRVNQEALKSLLAYKPRYFKWAGSDLFKVINEEGTTKMMLIETNSCPSGQKSMPPRHDSILEGTGYRLLIEKTFKPLVDELKPSLPEGVLAVIYDKNKLEVVGYAKTIAKVFNETVYIVECYDEDKNNGYTRWRNGVLEIQNGQGEWLKVRAAFRYVTQKPWSRFPISHSKTLIFNPLITCLAGGRNKMIAAAAFESFNRAFEKSGIKIITPETKLDVSKNEIPELLDYFGGCAVVKVPYSNAGQGVITITSPTELYSFMKDQSFHSYEKYVVQSLIGNSKWSSGVGPNKFFHCGSILGEQNKIYATDTRVMIGYDYLEGGLRPIAMYGRQAKDPLPSSLAENKDSWGFLGTNLSVKLDDGSFTTERERLVTMSKAEFDKLGLGLDDLISAFLQTVFSVVAIDQLACDLISADGVFNEKKFYSLNKDSSLMKEIIMK